MKRVFIDLEYEIFRVIEAMAKMNMVSGRDLVRLAIVELVCREHGIEFRDRKLSDLTIGEHMDLKKRVREFSRNPKMIYGE